jgi:hypothetical protein
MPETLSKVRVAKLKQPLASLVGIFATWATWFDSLDSHRGESLCQRHNFLKASNVIGQASGHSWRDSQRLVNPAKETETLPRFVVEEKTEIVVARKGSELDGS